MFYPEIIDRYTNIIIKENGVTPKSTPEYPTNPAHLLWMLLEIKTSLNMSETKKHRWLGFVQGCMVASNLISVKDEMEFTRNIFAGK